MYRRCVMHDRSPFMVVNTSNRRLTKNELVSVEKVLFELTRKQKNQGVPVELPTVDDLSFWSSVGQLLQHMETELSETIRDEGMNAKAQLLSRRLGVARTCVRDFTRMRLNAFTSHAVMSNLMRGLEGEADPSNGFQRLEWGRHDPAERIFYTGIGNLTEKYKSEVYWSALLGLSEETRQEDSVPLVHKPLTQFTEERASEPARSAREPARDDGAWEEPDIDEEDRIRDLDAFPEHATSQAESKSFQESHKSTGADLIRIRILKNVTDPILTADGSEMVLTEGDVESCPSLLAETLIAAGLAEPAPI